MTMKLRLLKLVEKLAYPLIIAIITATLIFIAVKIYGHLKETDAAISRIEALYGQEDVEELKAEYQNQLFWEKITVILLTFCLVGIEVAVISIVPDMMATAFLRKK